MCALVTGVQTCALPIYAVLRTGLARWLDRLALPATVRFRRLLRGSARHARERLLAHRAGRRASGRLTPLPAGHNNPRDDLRDRLRRGDSDRLHAARQRSSEEHTSELQSLMRTSYAVCW